MDKKHGRGKLTSSDGTIMEGEWFHGMREGKGVEVLKNGSRFEGEYKQDSKNGFGIYIWENGSVYTGEWINNQISGIVSCSNILLFRASKLILMADAMKGSSRTICNMDWGPTDALREIGTRATLSKTGKRATGSMNGRRAVSATWDGGARASKMAMEFL
jgi:hypothetical protein